MYSTLSLDRQYNFAGLAYPFGGFGTISASWINFGIRYIDGRDQTGQATEMFSDSENAFLFSYGIQIIPNLAFGASVKLLRHNLADRSASGMGYDAGILFKPSELVTLGASVQNLQTTISWNTQAKTQEAFPRMTRLGAHFKPIALVAFSAGYDLLEQQNGKWHAGGEIFLGKNLGLRAGNDDGALALGASLIAFSGNNTFEVEYGFTNESFDRNASHRFGLLLKIGKSQDKQTVIEETRSDQAEPPPEPPVEYSLLPAQVLEKKGHYLIVNLGQNDGLKPGMQLEICYATSNEDINELCGMAEVNKAGARHAFIIMKKASQLVPSAGDKISVKILQP
jgi:hypothetical protein